METTENNNDRKCSHTAAPETKHLHPSPPWVHWGKRIDCILPHFHHRKRNYITMASSFSYCNRLYSGGSDVFSTFDVNPIIFSSTTTFFLEKVSQSSLPQDCNTFTCLQCEGTHSSNSLNRVFSFYVFQAHLALFYAIKASVLVQCHRKSTCGSLKIYLLGKWCELIYRTFCNIQNMQQRNIDPFYIEYTLIQE